MAPKRFVDNLTIINELKSMIKMNSKALFHMRVNENSFDMDHIIQQREIFLAFNMLMLFVLASDSVYPSNKPPTYVAKRYKRDGIFYCTCAVTGIFVCFDFFQR